MSNLSTTTTFAASFYVRTHWVGDPKASFFKREVAARAAHLVLTPASLITNTIDTAIGIVVGLGAICTFGADRDITKLSDKYLYRARHLLVDSYVNALRALNPHAKFSWPKNGLISNLVLPILKTIILRCSESESFVTRHCVSRLTCVLFAVASVITRVADAILIIPTVPLSFLACGKSQSLNSAAFNSLQATGIIHDLFFSATRFLNPFTN